MNAHGMFRSMGTPGHSTGDLLDIIFPPIDGALKAILQSYPGVPSNQLIQLSNIGNYERLFMLRSRDSTESY